MKQYNLDSELKQSWDEFKAGNYITEKDLMKKYGIQRKDSRRVK